MRPYIQSVIRIKIFNFDKIKPDSTQRYTVHLYLPWFGNVSNRFTEQISSVVQQCYISANTWFVFSTKLILTFTWEDIFPPHHNCSCVYLFKCSHDLHNIREISQGLDVRIKQHVPTKIRNFTGLSMNILNNTRDSYMVDHQIKNSKCINKPSVKVFSIWSKAHFISSKKFWNYLY